MAGSAIGRPAKTSSSAANQTLRTKGRFPRWKSRYMPLKDTHVVPFGAWMLTRTRISLRVLLCRCRCEATRLDRPPCSSFPFFAPTIISFFPHHGPFSRSIVLMHDPSSLISTILLCRLLFCHTFILSQHRFLLYPRSPTPPGFLATKKDTIIYTLGNPNGSNNRMHIQGCHPLLSFSNRPSSVFRETGFVRLHKVALVLIAIVQ